MSLEYKSFWKSSRKGRESETETREPLAVGATSSRGPSSAVGSPSPLVQQLIFQADSLQSISRNVESQMKREGIPVLAATRDFLDFAAGGLGTVAPPPRSSSMPSMPEPIARPELRPQDAPARLTPRFDDWTPSVSDSKSFLDDSLPLSGGPFFDPPFLDTPKSFLDSSPRANGTSYEEPSFLDAPKRRSRGSAWGEIPVRNVDRAHDLPRLDSYEDDQIMRSHISPFLHKSDAGVEPIVEDLIRHDERPFRSRGVVDGPRPVDEITGRFGPRPVDEITGRFDARPVDEVTSRFDTTPVPVWDTVIPYVSDPSADTRPFDEVTSKFEGFIPPIVDRQPAQGGAEFLSFDRPFDEVTNKYDGFTIPVEREPAQGEAEFLSRVAHPGAEAEFLSRAAQPDAPAEFLSRDRAFDEVTSKFEASPVEGLATPVEHESAPIEPQFLSFDRSYDTVTSRFEAEPAVAPEAPAPFGLDVEPFPSFAQDVQPDMVSAAYVEPVFEETAPVSEWDNFVPFGAATSDGTGVLADWTDHKSFHSNDHARAYDIDLTPDEHAYSRSFVPGVEIAAAVAVVPGGDVLQVPAAEVESPAAVVETPVSVVVDEPVVEMPSKREFAPGVDALVAGQPQPLEATIEVSAQSARGLNLAGSLGRIADHYRTRAQATATKANEVLADAALEEDVEEVPVIVKPGIPGQIAHPYMVKVHNNLEIPKVPPYIWQPSQEIIDRDDAGMDPFVSWTNCSGNRHQLSLEL